jgi:hypothetical protein
MRQMDIDRIIKEKFTSSFMNDSKWDKLIETLTDKLDEIFINYKLIHDDKIHFTSLDTPDFKPFFIEPTFYKEVEWIEFPKTFNIKQNKRTTRTYIKEQKQDIDSIEKIINQIGKFMIEKEDNSIKLYAYR